MFNFIEKKKIDKTQILVQGKYSGTFCLYRLTVFPLIIIFSAISKFTVNFNNILISYFINYRVLNKNRAIK